MAQSDGNAERLLSSAVSGVSPEARQTLQQIIKGWRDHAADLDKQSRPLLLTDTGRDKASQLQLVAHAMRRDANDLERAVESWLTTLPPDPQEPTTPLRALRDAQGFHSHLDVCQRCANHPMDLCAVGARLLHGTASVPLPPATTPEFVRLYNDLTPDEARSLIEGLEDVKAGRIVPVPPAPQEHSYRALLVDAARDIVAWYDKYEPPPELAQPFSTLYFALKEIDDAADLPAWLKDEQTGNQGRREWNSRPQSAEDAQAMLAGAIRTIDRLVSSATTPEKQCEVCNRLYVTTAECCGQPHGSPYTRPENRR